MLWTPKSPFNDGYHKVLMFLYIKRTQEIICTLAIKTCSVKKNQKRYMLTLLKTIKKMKTSEILYHFFISHFYANIASFFLIFFSSFNDIQIFLSMNLELQYVQKQN